MLIFFAKISVFVLFFCLECQEKAKTLQQNDKKYPHILVHILEKIIKISQAANVDLLLSY